MLLVSALSGHATDAPIPCVKGDNVEDCTDSFDIRKRRTPVAVVALSVALQTLTQATAKGLSVCIAGCDEVMPTYPSPEVFKACRNKCEAAKAKCSALAENDPLESPFRSCLLSSLSGIDFYSICRFSESQRMGKHSWVERLK